MDTDTPERWDNPTMNEPQPISPRRRMQELLAIPDNQRTDAEWDELNELEISLAPGNREGAPDPNLRRPSPSSGIGRKPVRNARPGGQQQPRPGGQQPRPRPPAVQQQAKPPAPPREAVQARDAVPAKVGEDGQPKKPARKFRKRTPKPATAPGADSGSDSGSGSGSAGGSGSGPAPQE